MLFHDVATTFEQVEKESSRVKMTQLLSELFSRATPYEAEVLANLSLGTMRAPYQGYFFNFAEKGMKEVVARVLDVTPETVANAMVKTGDLGAVVATGSWTIDKQLELLEIYRALEDFEKLSGSGSYEEKITTLAVLLKKVDPLSAQYLVRIVLQKLRLGFSEMTVIDTLSWMLVGDKSLREQLEYAFNVSADIGLLARLAREGGIDAINKISITVGVPIRPAAAERMPSAAAIIEKLGPCVAQPKFDGFRLQVHIDNSSKNHKIHFFSRNMLDMSQMFPELTQAVDSLPVETLVMEGEALAYDEETGSYLPFQETVKRRRKHDIAQTATEFPLKLVLFDILYLDGQSLLDQPERNRLEILEKLIKAGKSELLSVAEQVKIETPDQLEAYFNKSITAGLEGVVVKRPDARYQPGKRNFNWIKLKRTQRGKLEDTIDAVVLGYYHGKGKRAGFGIGAILVGVFDTKNDRFETIAKIGTGLSDDSWVALKSKCDALAVKSAPHNVVVPKELAPDVWVAPEMVVVVLADEITRSPVHTAGIDGDKPGYALRFPRFVEYRIDKKGPEATSVDEIREMFVNQSFIADEKSEK